MIRPLAGEDCDPVLRLLRRTECFNETEIRIAEELIDITLGRAEQTDYHAFVRTGVPSGSVDVAGFLLLGPTPATVGTWDLYWIAVQPESQGRGIAQELDEFAGAFILQRGGYWLLAETSGSPEYARARAFYRKQCYVELARIPDYYRLADDLVIYGKRFLPPSLT